MNLGFISGMSSCERQNLDMMKSRLSFVLLIVLQLAEVSVKKIPELLETLNGNIIFELFLRDLDEKITSAG